MVVVMEMVRNDWLLINGEKWLITLNILETGRYPGILDTVAERNRRKQSVMLARELSSLRFPFCKIDVCIAW